MGNRIEHSKNVGSWEYDANNRLTEKGLLLGKTSYSYDPTGNLTQKTQGGNSTHYSYDSQNRLIQVSDKDNNPIARYGYDPFDRRIWKEAYRNKDGAPLSQPKRSYYLYSDEGLIAEASQAINPLLPVGEGQGEGQNVTATTAPTITTQYGPRPNGEFTTATLFIKTKNSAGQNTIAYYHHDHLGTPIQATDRSGIVVWSAQYNAFGNVNITTPIATEDKPTIESNLRFSGQVEDAETGLYYNWHRYYDPELGRYVTADPIGLEGGVNFYAYVNGNPVNAVDPTGLFAQTLPWVEPVIAYCWVNPLICAAVVGGGVIISEIWGEEYPGVYDDLQKDIEYRANNRQYKNRCNEKVPPGLTDPCEIAKWKLQRALDCKALRDANTKKWHGGKDDRHNPQLHDDNNGAIDRARKAVERHCKKC